MENLKFGSIVEVDFFKKNGMHDFDFEASGDKFYNFSEYGVLLLSVNKTCFDFDTHFINTTKLLWNNSQCNIENGKESINLNSDAEKYYYLFVHSKNKKDLFFLGKIFYKDVKEAGKRVEYKPYMLKGSILTLEKTMNDKLWAELGWNRNNLSIKGLNLPGYFIREYCNVVGLDKIKIGEKNVHFPYIYMLPDLNNYLDNLFKIGKEILNQNLASGKFICIGEISSEEYIVLNYAKSTEEPTVEKFYSTFIIANSIEEFINDNYDNVEDEL